MHKLKENLEKHRARFDEIMSCKDKSIRNRRLDSLETDMENTYGIPRVGMTKIEAFANSPDYAPVFSLYLKARNARWQ